MKSKLIVFRGALSAKSKFAVGAPISFPDGSEGIIKSILDIQLQPDNTVFVIGKYKPNEV